MKTKLLVFIMFWIGLISFSQNTTIPDDNFENYLETHDASGNTVTLGDALSMGNGIANDNTVTTANINTVTTLDVGELGISDLTGIEDFVSLSELKCDNNNLTSLDVSNNTALTALICDNNQLTTIDVSENVDLYLFYCGVNQLTNLDLTKNVALQYFWCNANNLSSLDFRNGNNTLIFDFVALTNPNLFCIDVDDATYSASMWFNIDPQCSFSENCGSLGTEDFDLESFTMYPNPVNEKLTITLNEESTYSIVNVNGQVLKKGKLGPGDNTLMTSQLSKGLYFLDIRTDSGFIFKKLVKQ